MKAFAFISLTFLLAGMYMQRGLCQDARGAWQVFDSDSILELTICLDIDSIRADRGEDPSYQDAVLSYTDPGENKVRELNINVRARGSFRKDPENCDFPPLKIRIRRTERQGSIFEDVKEFKMVTHCLSDIHEFEQYVVEEYLIYKAYNIFTDYSFRVRLARITYVDLPERTDSLTRLAFLLEDADDMARRNQGELLDLKSVPAGKLDRYHFALLALFNYMILNTDYSVSIVHNIELVSIDHFKPPIPVPYDFDWSGMIDIPYDSPYADSKTRYTGRVYKGPCIKRRERKEVFPHMLSKRGELFDLYAGFPYLDSEIKGRNMQDLRMFYIIMEDKELVRQEFKKNCID